MAQSPQPPLALGDFLERCMGNSTIAALVLDKFEKQLHADMPALETHLARRDVDQIARAAHALKGSAGAAAAAELQGVAERVEGFARQRQIESIRQSLSELRTEVERCLAYLPAARGMLARSPDSAAAAAESKR
jgi:HPt (histidine-containing phosphotransfer) domain-containing protein